VSLISGLDCYIFVLKNVTKTRSHFKHQAMKTDRYRRQRQEAIPELLFRGGQLSVDRLAAHFEVTGATIRSDLRELEHQGRVIRVHGGAMAVRRGPVPEQPLAIRLEQHKAEKMAIGRMAAFLVSDGDSVALDASSTSLAVAHHLKDKKGLRIVTTSLAAAQLFLDSPSHELRVSGGLLRHESASLIGPECLAFLARQKVRMAFLSVHAFHPQLGLCEISKEESAVKVRLMEMAEQCVVVGDSSKWRRKPVPPFAAFDSIDVLITDPAIPARYRDVLRRAGVEVVIASTLDTRISGEGRDSG
jgi:DeoR/GlpR family transcriptional regulator of sugar metabolism